MSELERLLYAQIEQVRIPLPTLEHRFHSVRRWRFDFAWIDHKLAVEVEGATWARGRHTRGGGFEADCEKYNAAVLLGWRVLRFTGGMVEDGRAIKTIKAATLKFGY